MFFSIQKPFEIVVPGYKSKLEVSDAPDPRPSRPIQQPNLLKTVVSGQ
jgi:hypothetical protein